MFSQIGKQADLQSLLSCRLPSWENLSCVQKPMSSCHGFTLLHLVTVWFGQRFYNDTLPSVQQPLIRLCVLLLSGEASRPSRYSEKALKSSDERETYLINFINKIKLSPLVSVVLSIQCAFEWFSVGQKFNQSHIFLRCLWAKHPRYFVSFI